MNYDVIMTLVCSIVGSSAVFGFIQFVVNRNDQRSDRYNDIVKEIAALRKAIDDLHGDVGKIEAINARIRILDASDQVRMHMKHSEEYFIQINDDITLYNRYCDKHPEFRNNRASHAIENINNCYSKLLKEGGFL